MNAGRRLGMKQVPDFVGVAKITVGIERQGETVLIFPRRSDSRHTNY